MALHQPWTGLAEEEEGVVVVVDVAAVVMFGRLVTPRHHRPSTIRPREEAVEEEEEGGGEQGDVAMKRLCPRNLEVLDASAGRRVVACPAPTTLTTRP